MAKPKNPTVENGVEKERKVMDKVLVATVLKPKQNILNLETGKDESIQFEHFRFTARAPKDGETSEEIRNQAISELREMLGSEDAVMVALLDYATSNSYQTAKKDALSKGKFLTQEVKSKIVAYMRSMAQFAELSAADAFERWKAGFLDTENPKRKASAEKILATVTQDSEFSDL